MNVGVDVVRHPVGNAGADRERLEPIRVARGKERRDVATLAPAHAADAILVHQALLHERVDARQHIPRVADAEVAHVQRSERLAVTGAATVVGLEHERALGEEPINRVVADLAIGHRPRHARRSAVNHDQQGIAASGLEISRLVQHAFDLGAVLALPLHHFSRVLRPRCDLRARVADLPRRHRLHRRDVDVGKFGGAGTNEGRRRAVGCERERSADPLIANRMARRLFSQWIQVKQVRPRALRRREEDAAARPGHDVRRLIERVGQAADVVLARRDHGDDAVLEKVERLAHGRGERDLGAVG